MGVYDRWHKSQPPGDSAALAELSVMPSSVHVIGDRWQVRWRPADDGSQRKRNIARKTGKNPAIHADVFDVRNRSTRRLILTRRGELAMHRDRPDEEWRRALVKAGIVEACRPDDKRWPPRHRMHVLRHTAASAWLSAGKSPAAVAAWLGDAVETALAIYAHLMPGDEGSGRKAMDAFFNVSAPDVPSAAKR